MNSCNSKLVSIVVPVYNVEHFLEHCINTILNQTYDNFEMILVDDGSTDSSGDICETWAKKDERISVIHQANGGLSAARNSGIDVSKGEYICFIDSDDFITPNYIKDFVNALESSNADFAICDIVSSKLASTEKIIDKNIVFMPEDCKEWLSNPISREYVLMVVAWNKMFRSTFWKDKHFEVGYIHEDEFMINEIIYSMSKAVFVPAENYIYRINEESITGKGNAGNVKHLHVIDAYEKRIQKALENKDNIFAQTTLKWAMLKLAKFYKEGSDEMKKASQSKYQKLLSGYENILSEKQKMKYKIFNISPTVFCKLFVKQ